MKKTATLLLAALICCLTNGESLPALSLDAMDWDVPNVVPWGWGKNSVFNYTNGGYIYSRNTPFSSEAACEFTVRVNKKLNKNKRAEAAIVLCDQNRENRYLFGPVAERNGTAKVELKLFVNGKYMNGKNCRVSFKNGKNLNWKYGTEYRFRLNVKNGIATGTVCDKNGKILAELTAVPDKSIIKRAVFPMRTALYTSGLTAVFSDARASYGKEIELKTAPPAPPVPYIQKPHAPSVQGRKTGFFHVEKMPSGQWWIIDPNGFGFYANGIDAIYYRGNFCETLGYSPYYQNIRKRFPTVDKWVGHTSSRLRDWGFNFIGTGEKALRKNFAYSINMMLGSSFAAFGDEYNITPYKGRCNTALPNVFHPRFREYCERKISNDKARRNDPYCLGLFSDNELRWHGGSLNPDGSGVFDSVMEKNPGHSAKKALVGFLKEYYRNDINKFNAVWNTRLTGFSRLFQLKKLVHNNGEALKAKQDFLYLVADKYFSTMKNAMRNAAPNHMYIGCRSAGITSAHEKVWLASGKYCDIVTVNQYPVMDFDKGEIFVHLTGESFNQAFGNLYKLTNRPLMITEWSFLSMDSGLPNSRGAGQRVRTQQERARAGEMFLRTCLALPFMVGHNFYMYLDYPKQGARKSHPEDGNYGIVNVKDEPYRIMTDMFKRNQKTDPAILRKNNAPEPLSKVTSGKIYRELLAKTKGRKLRSSANGFTVSNGIIKLENDGSSAAVKVYCRGKYIGVYNLMVRFLDRKAATVWMDADRISNVKVSGSGAVEADIHNRKFRCRTKIILPENSNFFMSEITEISNPSKKENLILEGIYFRAYADFEVDFSLNHRYYDKYAFWTAKDKSCVFGGVATGTRIAYYYHNTRDKQHPDGFYMFRKSLRPGEKVKPSTPCYSFTFVANSPENAEKTVRCLVNGDLKDTEQD